MKRMTIALALLCCAAGCGHKPDTASQQPDAQNSVVAYFTGAELQAETADQRREVLRALDDVLQKPAAELRDARYSDYSGRPGVRTLVELFTAHFVPPRPAALDPERFYADIGAPEARSVIQAHRDRLSSALRSEK